MADFSHHGRRRRAEEIQVLGYPQYWLRKLPQLKQIRPLASDPDRTSFLVEYEIRRWLSNQNRWASKPLKIRPKRGRVKGRFGLAISSMAGKKGLYYHRMVALTCCPVCTNEEGLETDPWFVQNPTVAKQFEVHHAGRGNNTHDCRAGSLFVLYKKHHKSLQR